MAINAKAAHEAENKVEGGAAGAKVSITPVVAVSVGVNTTQARIGTLHFYLPTPSREYWGDLQALGEQRRVELRARAGLHVGDVLTWENSPEAVKVGAKSMEELYADIGIGKRMPIKATRALLNAALDGSLNDVEFRKDPNFGFEVPVRVPGVDPDLLDPRAAWADRDEYDRTAEKLVQLFVDNFAQFEAHVDQGVRDAAPTLQAETA